MYYLHGTHFSNSVQTLSAIIPLHSGRVGFPAVRHETRWVLGTREVISLSYKGHDKPEGAQWMSHHSNS